MSVNRLKSSLGVYWYDTFAEADILDNVAAIVIPKNMASRGKTAKAVMRLD